MEQFTPCFSDDLKSELRRLKDSKNTKLSQRYDMIQSGIMKTLLNPKKTDNIIVGLSPYWAEKVGGQIRLFYEMIPGTNIVHFVWVNNENCMHDTNNGQANDPCYIEFTRLYHKQALGKYTPEEVVEGKYNQNAPWKSLAVYATYKEADEFSDCNMILEASGDLEYSIISISSNSTDGSLEQKLISEVLESASSYEISFSYDLYLGISVIEVNKIRDALIENGFKLSESFADMETWKYSS